MTRQQAYGIKEKDEIINNVYVARQPIFDSRKKILGYELLFREDMKNIFPGIDGNVATSKLLSNTFFNIGLTRITGRKKAFINFTYDLLIKKVPLLFDNKTTVVEILEDVETDSNILSACKEIAEKNYTIALDDFVYKKDLEELMHLSHIIKIDFRATSREEIREFIKLSLPYKVSLLAEKVENYDEFNIAKDMGFSYFQGYFFSKPEIIKAKEIPSLKVNFLQIMSEANRRDLSFTRLEKYISHDVGISYKLLRYINSPYFRRIEKISSIKQAIVMLGENGIRQFLSLIALSELVSNKPQELLRNSVIRAKFCELLGDRNPSGLDKSELFTLGLFSLIDAILDDSMENVMSRLPLSENIKNALLKGEGRLADFLKLVISYETGDWDNVSALSSHLGVNEEKLPLHYLEAIIWADAISEI
ncbi:MAG: HDOD domain-containing protein [Deltaproteobacteria bacterium]|nr:HDOD domain-containing protein [Deltaproteobacteria bacterium]